MTYSQNKACIAEMKERFPTGLKISVTNRGGYTVLGVVVRQSATRIIVNNERTGKSRVFIPSRNTIEVHGFASKVQLAAAVAADKKWGTR